MGLCVICMEYRNCKRCMCGGGFYCSRECQKWHWADAPEPHCAECPVKVCQDHFRTMMPSMPKHVADLIFSYIHRRAA